MSCPRAVRRRPNKDVGAVGVGEVHRLNVDDDGARRAVLADELLHAAAESVGIGEKQWSVDARDKNTGVTSRPFDRRFRDSGRDPGSRPRRRTDVCDDRAISSSSESTTPITIPAMIPTKGCPAIAPRKNAKSAAVDPVVAPHLDQRHEPDHRIDHDRAEGRALGGPRRGSPETASSRGRTRR